MNHWRTVTFSHIYTVLFFYELSTVYAALEGKLIYQIPRNSRTDMSTWPVKVYEKEFLKCLQINRILAKLSQKFVFIIL